MPSSTIVLAAAVASFRLFIQVKTIAKIVAIADIAGITASTTIEQASGPVAGFSSVPSPLKLNLSLKWDSTTSFILDGLATALSRRKERNLAN